MVVIIATTRAVTLTLVGKGERAALVTQGSFERGVAQDVSAGLQRRSAISQRPLARDSH